MTVNKVMTLAVLAAFALAPTAVLADAPKVSYSAKKQGRVAFQEQTQDDTAAAQQDATQATNPAEIEPAAGGYEPQEESQDTSLSESMKLPRKN